MKKKLVVTLMACTMVFTLAACGKEAATTETVATETVEAETSEVTETEVETETVETTVEETSEAVEMEVEFTAPEGFTASGATEWVSPDYPNAPASCSTMSYHQNEAVMNFSQEEYVSQLQAAFALDESTADTVVECPVYEKSQLMDMKL